MNDWKVNTMREASQEQNPIQYVVSGLIERPSVNVVYGAAPDILNTLLLLDMSACVVKGLPWLRNDNGAETKPTTKLGVLWLGVDNDVQRTHLYTQAIGSHYGLSESDSFYYVSMPAGGLDMADDVSVESLAKLVSPDVGLVVIDNLSSILGKTDKGPSEMVRVISSFRALAEQHQLALVILHDGNSWDDNQFTQTGVDLTLDVVTGAGTNLFLIAPKTSRGYEIAAFGAQCCWEEDETSIKQAWFEGIEAYDIAMIIKEENSRDDAIHIFVLLHKDGYMEVFPLSEYVFGERSMLQRDSSYKSEWVPIAYGSFAEMQKDKEEIEKKGLGWYIESE